MCITKCTYHIKHLSRFNNSIPHSITNTHHFTSLSCKLWLHVTCFSSLQYYCSLLYLRWLHILQLVTQQWVHCSDSSFNWHDIQLFVRTLTTRLPAVTLCHSLEHEKSLTLQNVSLLPLSTFLFINLS